MASSEIEELDKNDDDGDGNLSDLVESFALMPQIMDKYETRFFDVEQSELYKPAGAIMPKLPMYHPYHPFKNASNGDDILQVPLAMLLPSAERAPVALLERIAKSDAELDVTPYFVAQTLPYDPGTDVICRYHYALFPEAEYEMSGHESIWAQGIIYEGERELARLPATEIKIYESDKGKESSPTVLCGDSMRLDTAENLRGRALWSLVSGCPAGEVDDDGMFTEATHAFVGLTYFIPDDDAYQKFLRSVRDKSPREVLTEVVPGLIDLNGCEDNLSER